MVQALAAFGILVVVIVGVAFSYAVWPESENK
jgi:hypothetical protein